MSLFLVILLLIVCWGAVWCDIHGISVVRLLRHALLASRVRRNLGVRFQKAWEIIGGRKC